MLKRLKVLILPAILSVVFIIATALVSVSNVFMLTGFGQFCFMFHLYPFGIGFSGGDTSKVVIYYLLLWLVLTILFLGLIYLIKLIFKPAIKK